MQNDRKREAFSLAAFIRSISSWDETETSHYKSSVTAVLLSNYIYTYLVLLSIFICDFSAAIYNKLYMIRFFWRPLPTRHLYCWDRQEEQKKSLLTLKMYFLWTFPFATDVKLKGKARQNSTCMKGVSWCFASWCWSGVCAPVVCQLKPHNLCALDFGKKPDVQTLSCVHRKPVKHYKHIYWGLLLLEIKFVHASREHVGKAL